MFDFYKEIIKYDELIKNIYSLIKEIDFNNTVKTFLCSLSSRAIHLRSFISSYYLYEKIMSYDFFNNENMDKELYKKYNIIVDDFNLEYQNVYNFEKYK